MAVISHQHGHVPGGTSGQSAIDQSGQNAPRTKKSWVAPSWERLETPMEVTMYAGQR
jgi:hypothetical protein